MKKPKRRQAVYTLREIAEAWNIVADWNHSFPHWLDDPKRFYGHPSSSFRRELHRIAARKRKGKK